MASASQNAKSSLVHVFLVSFPGQGNVNPLLRLAKRLASKGMLVTFSAPERVGKEMAAVDGKLITDQPTPYGDGMIRFEFFEDGSADCDPSKINDFELGMEMLEQAGRRNLPKILKKQEDEGRPVSCVINNPFIPWVCEIAESLGIPNALLWVQSCACFSIYYHYHSNQEPFPSESEPEKDVVLPSMPVLKYDELPTFLLQWNGFELVLKRIMLDQFRNLSKPFCILVDSFQELEEEVVEHMSKICPIRTIGPLLFDDLKTAGTTSVYIRGDCMKIDEDSIEWLDSKPPSSVVYISFGSIAVPEQEQVDEIAIGLLNSGISFLWVIKPPPVYSAFKPVVLPDGFLEKIGERGKIVKWCPQEQVLSHPSVAFFLTHCGWNSSMEAISSGVPIVAFPQWGDQVTNAKYLVDVFKMGIRLSKGVLMNKIITREEIENCLREATSNDSKVEEMKENALKWKKRAEEAVAERGSSAINIQEFVDELKNIHAKKLEEKRAVINVRN